MTKHSSTQRLFTTNIYLKYTHQWVIIYYKEVKCRDLKISMRNKNISSSYLSSVFWNVWKLLRIFWSAMCRAPQITPSIESGLSACTLSDICLSNQPVSILFSPKMSVSMILTKYSTVVRKSPRIDNSFKAITMFLQIKHIYLLSHSLLINSLPGPFWMAMEI